MFIIISSTPYGPFIGIRAALSSVKTVEYFLFTNFACKWNRISHVATKRWILTSSWRNAKFHLTASNRITSILSLNFAFKSMICNYSNRKWDNNNSSKIKATDTKCNLIREFISRTQYRSNKAIFKDVCASVCGEIPLCWITDAIWLLSSLL